MLGIATLTLKVDSNTNIDISGISGAANQLGYNANLVGVTTGAISGNIQSGLAVTNSTNGITRTYSILQTTDKIYTRLTQLEGVDLDDAMTGNAIKAGDNNGESASVTATNSFTQTGANLTIASADTLATNNGTSFSALNYIFSGNDNQIINITKNSGELSVNIGTLDLSQKNTGSVTLNIAKSAAYINIDTVSMDTNSTLLIASDKQATTTAMALKVAGDGATINLLYTKLIPAAKRWPLTLAALAAAQACFR